MQCSYERQEVYLYLRALLTKRQVWAVFGTSRSLIDQPVAGSGVGVARF